MEIATTIIVSVPGSANCVPTLAVNCEAVLVGVVKTCAIEAAALAANAVKAVSPTIIFCFISCVLYFFSDLSLKNYNIFHLSIKINQKWVIHTPVITIKKKL